MDKNRIQIIPFMGEKEIRCMSLVKFMERDGIKRYNILITGDTKILADNKEETKYKGDAATFKLISKTAYNGLITSQEDTVCFNIYGEEKMKSNKYREVM